MKGQIIHPPSDLAADDGTQLEGYSHGRPRVQLRILTPRKNLYVTLQELAPYSEPQSLFLKIKMLMILQRSLSVLRFCTWFPLSLSWSQNSKPEGKDSSPSHGQARERKNSFSQNLTTELEWIYLKYRLDITVCLCRTQS